MKRVQRARRRAEFTESGPQVDEAGPFVERAREIQAEVARIAADPSAQGDLLDMQAQLAQANVSIDVEAEPGGRQRSRPKPGVRALDEGAPEGRNGGEGDSEHVQDSEPERSTSA
jgi:hypothetical protein